MALQEIFLESLKESMTITLIIFVLMILIEILVLRYKEAIIHFAKKSKWMSYFVASFFGIIPGCIGTFAMDSLYMAGLLSFGGILATMVATSGDEAFLMLSLAATGKLPWSVLLLLMGTLFLFGILAGWLGDVLLRKMKLRFCEKCSIEYHHHHEFKLGHFIKEHIGNHILKKHIWKIFLWIFAALFIIGISKDFINPEVLFSGVNMWYVLIVASLLGILPISGPNVFLIMLFVQGYIPFSVLLANSIIQDGHGLLPILGFSLEDAMKIKVVNFLFGIAIGSLLLVIGL